MKRLPSRYTGIISATLIMIFMPVLLAAQTQSAEPGKAPSQVQVAPPLVREGDLAVRLVKVLGLGAMTDETEAETRLGDAGVIPRNGWIADYPVTPDVAGELQKSAGRAADSGRLKLSRDEAVKRLKEAFADLQLSVVLYTGQAPAMETAPYYPDSDELNDYYADEGPPVYTFYSPPPDYYYLYEYISCPFWWYDLWFPGFYILIDFHRHIYFDRRIVICSNHFRDVKAHRVFRIDPAARFSGRTFAGIGAPRGGRFVKTGVAKSDVRIFNAPSRGGTAGVPARGRPAGAAGPPPGYRAGMVGPPSGGGGGAFIGPSGGGHPSGGGGFGGGRGGGGSRGGGGRSSGGGFSSGGHSGGGHGGGSGGGGHGGGGHR